MKKNIILSFIGFLREKEKQTSKMQKKKLVFERNFVGKGKAKL